MGVRAGSLVGRVVGALVLAVVLLVVPTATAIWWTARQDSQPPADAIVVLGSAQYNGVPSSIFEARLEHALELYEDGVAPVVVTVGGKADGDQFTEAESGRAYLAEAGITADSSPTRQGPAVQTRTTQFRYILRETAAYLLYRATGESVAGAPGIG